MRDLRCLITLALLMTGGFAATTGLIAEIWDLNEFVLHKYSAFLTAGLAALHAWLHRRQLVAYLQSRLASLAGSQRRNSDGSAQLTDTAWPAAKAGGTTTRAGRPNALSRRALLTLLVGAGGGFLLGRWTAPGQRQELRPDTDLGEAYHQWSKPGYQSLFGVIINWGRQPAPFKEYAWAPKVALPPPYKAEGLSLEEAIRRRRSVRDYSGHPLSLEDLSRLLYYACGITETRWGIGLRAAPSAGALYPIEVYPVIHRVTGLAPGIYHYSYADHALEQLRLGDFRAALVQGGVAQEFLGEANVVFILTAVFQRTRWKYQERAYRYVLLEAGHIGQNVYLAATSMGLGACAVGAFFDDDLNRLLEIDGVKEAVIYLLAVGRL